MTWWPPSATAAPTAIPATFKAQGALLIQGSGPSPLTARERPPRIDLRLRPAHRLPTEDQIIEVRADFIVGAYGSAFAEDRPDGSATSDSRKGIYSNITVGPCDGVNSDFFPAGTQHGQMAPAAVTEPGPVQLLMASLWSPVVRRPGCCSAPLGTYLLPHVLKLTIFYSEQAMRRT